MRWKKDLGIFGMNPPEIGGYVKGNYYVGGWKSYNHKGFYEVVLGKFKDDCDVIIKARRKVPKQEVKSLMKKYMEELKNERSND